MDRSERNWREMKRSAPPRIKKAILDIEWSIVKGAASEYDTTKLEIAKEKLYEVLDDLSKGANASG